MQKPALLAREPVSRFLLSFLLAVGILLPLLMLFGLGSQIFMTLALCGGMLALLTLQAGGKPWSWLVPVLFVVAGLLQFVLPGLGFFGGSFQALKAAALFFSGLEVVMPLFGTQVALLLAVGVSVCAFLFTGKGVGFLPSAIMVVLVLFGMWALGKGHLVWYTLPALCALLLLISQSAHEKISMMNVLPMAAAVALLALLLLPPGRVTIQPLEKAAFQLKQTITDYLFFTEPRNVFTLGSYGYYPMGNNQLGGEAEPTEFPVMIVQTQEKTLLRGVVKDEYNGRSFRDTSSAKRYLYINPIWSSYREQAFLEKYPPEGIRKASSLLGEKSVTVQMQNKTASTIFTPVFLRDIQPQGDIVPYFNAASELFATRDLESGDRYTVRAPLFEGGDSGLDALVNAAPKEDAYYAEIYSAYTRLPDHLEQKLYDDLANIIRDAQTPYDKAMAIQRHLQRYYRYTLSPATPPENQDFVTYFLYVGKEGYCTYYASAMTVLCRMAGLPSRYVEGFLALPASDGLAYVTGKEAHAWTEVYFEGFGWVPFDPTPPQQDVGEPPPNDPPPPDEPEPTPSPDPEDNPEPSPEPSPEPPNPEDNQEDPPPDEPPPPEDQNPFPWLLLLLIVAGISAGAFQVLRHMPDRMAAKAASEQDKIFIYGGAVNLILRLLGRMPKPGETPLRFARRMDSVHAVAEPILPLWRVMALSNYSRRPLSPDQTAKARDTFQGIYQPLSFLMKLRFLFLVGFQPSRYRSLETEVVHEPAVSKTRLPGPKPPSGKKSTFAGKKPSKGKADQSGKPVKPVKPVKSGKSGKPVKPKKG